MAIVPSITLPMWVAQGNSQSRSLDGGVTWIDTTESGAVSCVSAIPHISAFVIDSAGALYCSEAGDIWLYNQHDGLLLELNVPGAKFVHCWYDLLDFDVVWALAEDGRLYRNNALGQSGFNWFLYDDLRLVHGVASMVCSRIATPLAGGVWIYGGHGGPLIMVDPNKDHGWI